MRQELYLSYFLAVCVKRSFSVAVSAEFFGVMAVSENPIRNLVKHDNLFVYTCYIRNLVTHSNLFVYTCFISNVKHDNLFIELDRHIWATLCKNVI